ncbi:MOSC domain-containing protein [Parendozoicomonas haliclonae]|uniref:MOSC domain protein n=1 Tax=Parendozoicomonas haliclonae TaxID=1960125 RepID=A0A1X7AM97_9GAMM|nr:MOSC N-terminal beta barrel domain-containing protein [Parendozoicomonas haliclonae]SMA49098.1 MOSC domain protein [Parendozoicomonas haliclonae]
MSSNSSSALAGLSEKTSGPVVSQLAVYPVKSLAQYTASSFQVDSFGFAGDRRWMVVKSQDGSFITGRAHPAIVLLRALIGADGLTLISPHGDQVQVPYPVSDQRVMATVWGDTCAAIDAGDEAAHWLSAYLKEDCRLVYMPESTHRQVDPRYAEQGMRTGFADGFPFLLISEASLELLNSKLEQPITMNRFRPNIVVSGCEPHEEDSWKRIRIGDIEFSLVKNCTRCVFTTVDPATGEKGTEPLKTLAGYRRAEKGIIFGQNMVHHGVGQIDLGMPVEILE